MVRLLFMNYSLFEIYVHAIHMYENDIVYFPAGTICHYVTFFNSIFFFFNYRTIRGCWWGIFHKVLWRCSKSSSKFAFLRKMREKIKIIRNSKSLHMFTFLRRMEIEKKSLILMIAWGFNQNFDGFDMIKIFVIKIYHY